MPKATVAADGSVKWDLSELGVLENGVKYTVKFDVYPSQAAYDYIARIKNGDLDYEDLPDGVKEYLTEDLRLATNTEATLKYDDTRDEAGVQNKPYVSLFFYLCTLKTKEDVLHII